jgi:hypothetical protein
MGKAPNKEAKMGLPRKQLAKPATADAPAKDTARVPLHIDAALYREFKKCAIDEQKTYSQLAQELIAEYVALQKKRSRHASQAG